MSPKPFREVGYGGSDIKSKIQGRLEVKGFVFGRLVGICVLVEGARRKLEGTPDRKWEFHATRCWFYPQRVMSEILPAGGWTSPPQFVIDRYGRNLGLP
jgi:hypothetical protein